MQMGDFPSRDMVSKVILKLLKEMCVEGKHCFPAVFAELGSF